MPVELSRRRLLATAAAVSTLAACGESGLPRGAGNSGSTSSGGSGSSSGGDPTPSPTVPAHFLSTKEHRALTALVDQFIPADTDPGAVQAGCTEAICYLLAAFDTTPPFIYAGGPYSDRAGNSSNQFAQFLPLDAYEELAWRLTLEGSAERPERSFNGAHIGWQAIYRNGLARLDELAVEQGGADFAALTSAQRDTILRRGDAVVDDLVDIAFPHTLTAMYGAPEYGGNQDLVGWEFTAFDGDVQPRGYSDSQVVNCDTPQPTDGQLPASYHDPAQRQQSVAARIRQALFPTRSRARQPLLEAELMLAVAPPFEGMAAAQQAAEGRLSALRGALLGEGADHA